MYPEEALLHKYVLENLMIWGLLYGIRRFGSREEHVNEIPTCERLSCWRVIVWILSCFRRTVWWRVIYLRKWLSSETKSINHNYVKVSLETNKKYLTLPGAEKERSKKRGVYESMGLGETTFRECGWEMVKKKAGTRVWGPNRFPSPYHHLKSLTQIRFRLLSFPL